MEKYQVEAGKKEEILDEAIDASENPRLRGWLGWIEKTRSHQVSALQAGGERNERKLESSAWHLLVKLQWRCTSTVEVSRGPAGALVQIICTTNLSRLERFCGRSRGTG